MNGKQRKVKKVLIGLLLLGALAAVGTGTYATFTASTTNAGNTFATGTLVLSNTKGATTCLSTGGGNTNTNSNSTGCAVVFSPTVTKPTSTASGNLDLQNVGSLAGTLQVAAVAACAASNDAESYHGTGDPCTVIDVYFQEYTSNTFATATASCIYPFSATTACASLPQATQDGATLTALGGAGSVPSTPLSVAAGAHRYIQVTVTMQSGAGNSMQGRQAAIDLAWTLTQS